MVDMAAQQSSPVFCLNGLCIFKADATAQRHILSPPFTCSMCRAMENRSQEGQKKRVIHFVRCVASAEDFFLGDLHALPLFVLAPLVVSNT